MQGITSLEGHDKANNRMRNSLRMVVPQLSDEQKDKIMQDIMQTVSPQPEPAMPDNVNIGGQQFDMGELQQMPMQAAEGLADMGQGGDTELAHMDPETIAMAQAMGILPEAKQNVMTGLPAFQGDNPGEENDPNAPDPQDAADTSGVGGPGDGPADADLGATPQEVATMNAMASIAATEAPLDYSAAYDKATKGLSNAEIAQAREYGVFNSLAAIQSVGKAKDKASAIDDIAEARHANNPTNAQMGLNELTERGFQTANPGISQAVGIAGTLMGLAVPGVGLATTLGNVANTIAGQPTLMDLAVGNPTMTSTAVSGIKDSVSGFGKSITDALSGIGSLVGGTPDDSRDEPSDNEEPLIETVEEDLDDAVPPVAGVNAEQEKLIAEGYDPSTAELIVENFRSVDAFKQSYRSRFNAEPSASEMTDPSKQSFINIRRGQIQGMT